MYKFLTSKKGFTLVELMIVLVLLSFGFFALGNLFMAAYRSYNKTEERYLKQEAVKTVAELLQSGSGNVSSAKAVNIYNDKGAIPEDIDKSYSYIYAEESTDANNPGYFLYVRNRGVSAENARPLSDIPMYVTIKQIRETEKKDNKFISKPYNGVIITLAALEDDYDYSSGVAPTSDDIYYSLDVAYHFPNMVTSEDPLLVNHIAGMEKKIYSKDGYYATHCQALCGKDWYNCTHTKESTEGLVCNVETGACNCKLNQGIVLAVYCEEIISGDETNGPISVQSLCFIATASYGKGSGEVGMLCDFRDKILLTNPLGEAFVKTYYKLSPPIADFIAESEFLKGAVRTALKPLIVVAEYSLNEDIRPIGAASLAVFMLSGLGTTLVLMKVDKRKRRCK